LTPSISREELAKKVPLALRIVSPDLCGLHLTNFSEIDQPTIQIVADDLNTPTPVPAPVPKPIPTRKTTFMQVAKRIQDQEGMWERVHNYYAGHPDHEVIQSLLLDPNPELMLKLTEMAFGGNSEDLEDIDVVYPTNFDNDYTITDYQMAIKNITRVLSFDEAVFFHRFYIMSSVIIITCEFDYLHKIRNLRGNIRWQNISAKNLEKMLNRFQVEVRNAKGNRVSHKLFFFVQHAQIVRHIAQFPMSVFYDPDPSSPYFSVWREHAHPVIPPEVVAEKMKLIQPWLDFVRDIVCAKNESIYKSVIQQFGFMMQNPQEHGHWAIVLLSNEGTGKNFFCNVVCDLWGAPYAISNNSSMKAILKDESKRNLENIKLIICNELQSQGTLAAQKENWEVMKGRITEDWLFVRQLYGEYVNVPNLVFYILLSNNPDAIPMSAFDRRYCVLEPSDIHIQDHVYFRGLSLVVKHPEFLSVLLSYLLQVDLSDFEPRKCPDTEFKTEIREQSMGWHEKFCTEVRWEKPIKSRGEANG
jgi:hypothetical protein